MLANEPSKHDANGQPLWDLLTVGWWNVDGQIRIRHVVRVQNYDEVDLFDMSTTRTKYHSGPTSEDTYSDN